MISHQKVLDSLKAATYSINKLRKEFSYRTISKEEILGIKFRTGDIIYDRRTGKKGEVISTERKRII